MYPAVVQTMGNDLESIISQPEATRDEAWEQAFLGYIATTKVELVQDQSQRGPDGWPYLLVRTGPQGTEPFAQIVQWAAPRGIGLALNTHKMLPDYIFTYGMLWNFVETGQFVSSTSAPSPGEVNIAVENPVIFGEPTEKYLPKYVRAILKEFLAAQGFSQSRVVVMSSLDYKTVDLIFSVESLNNLDKSEHRTLAEALGWFLPLHYSLIIGSEQNSRGFVEL